MTDSVDRNTGCRWMEKKGAFSIWISAGKRDGTPGTGVLRIEKKL